MVIKSLSAVQKLQETDSIPQIRKIPLEKGMADYTPTPVYLGESHGQKSLVGYSPWGCKELDMSERLSMHPRSCMYVCIYVYTHTHLSVLGR